MMLPSLKPVSAADRPSATRDNEMARRLNRLPYPAIQTPAGLEDPPRPELTYLDLYQLTSDPEFDDDAKEYKVTGKRVDQRWCVVDGSGHFVALNYKTGSTKLREVVSSAATETLWILTTPRDENDEADSDGGYEQGDRVFVTTHGLVKAVLGGTGRSAPRCKALLKGVCASDDATTTVDNVEPIDGGKSPVENSSTELTVNNDAACAGPDDQPCWIEWDATADSGDGGWRLYQVKQVAKNIVKSWVDNETDTITVTTETVVGMWDDDEDDTEYTDNPECQGAE